MGERNVSGIVTASVTMLLCGAYNAVFNMIRRASHLLSTVREAAGLQSDYTELSTWRDIALSVYDLAVLFRLSSGMLAAVQAVTAAAGLIYAARHGLGKNGIKGAALPYALGYICIILGTTSILTLIGSKSADPMLTAVLALTQLIVPILFTIAAGKFHHAVKRPQAVRGG